MAPTSYIVVARTVEVIPLQPVAPYARDDLTVNLVFRVTLSFFANLVCVVPLKYLAHHGEFAAAVFVCTVIVLNALTIVNSLIWRDNNVENWWKGHVWCDVHPYIYQTASTIFLTSAIAIMQNLAQQVKLLRVGPVSITEKHRKMWLQFSIIFPLPIIQMGWLYPLSTQRYIIGPLKGCLWSATPSWPFTVFFLLPSPPLALLAASYSILAWKNYLEIEPITRSAIASDTSAAGRLNRTRCRLLFMITYVILPALVPICVYNVHEIISYYSWQQFNFRKVHYENNPWPWDSVILYTSDQMPFVELNFDYLYSATGVMVFVFFGFTSDTKDYYRRCKRAMRLDGLFNSLRDNSSPNERPDHLGPLRPRLS
ncbi:pheromone receptor 1 [Colletotrichum truncatum]|uniref:Pheromone receptor 1 n=1 Tax=Colletotrichum truncatum TaxID=5467 RepID=A0ACC3YIF7_COLTU